MKDRNRGTREVAEAIANARWTKPKRLSLVGKGIDELPEELGELDELEELDLSHNALSSLPDWLANLTELREVSLTANRFSALPTAVRSLRRLEHLRIDQNALEEVPEWIGDLQPLRILELDGNKISDLPATMRRLENLKELYLGSQFGGNPLGAVPAVVRQLKKLDTLLLDSCKLTDIPEWVGELSLLCELNCQNNRLTDLPGSVCGLDDLVYLSLGGNPLNPELAAAYEEGLEAVLSYLREKSKGTQQRYEAKLLVLGDGDEGKTCVSRALRGLPFEPQHTTRGVDVEPWSFPHPDAPGDETRRITLNVWDFEGQEINHQTHQFFLTTNSLYLLVFRCREQFRLDRARYWLDTIRARAPGARVAIVITECEQRTPYVPEELHAEYEDVLLEDGWLFAVGCEDGTGIDPLRECLTRQAADLDHMGRDWPSSYSAIEDRIGELAAAGTPSIARATLNGILADCGIDAAGFGDVAQCFATLGIVTQFPDCPDLSDFIVLQPQWLTKAISYVMEDRQLASDKGEIEFARMQAIWRDRDYEGMFAKFHDCMKEFELCYDLEDAKQGCLVPLRFGYERPEIPWSDDPALRERRVSYTLPIRPPIGLMSRFIVKTHHMIVTTPAAPTGIYWHNGVFLSTGKGALRSEALCEFDRESRTLSVRVRAAFPQNMIEQIHAYVKAVFAFFKGLEPLRSFGCIEIDAATDGETECPARHSERKISFAIESRERVACEEGRHHIDPWRLVAGIGSFGSDLRRTLREELDRPPEWAEPLVQGIATLVDWADAHGAQLTQLVSNRAEIVPELRQELELKLREYLGHMSELLDERHRTAAPCLFSLAPVDGSAWNPNSYFRQKYVLTPFCECDGNIHRHEPGRVEFTKNKKWWDATAPWIARGTKMLAVGLQLAFAGMPLLIGQQAYDLVKNDVTFMKQLSRHIELEATPDGFAAKHGAEVGGELATDLRARGGKVAVARAAMMRFLEATAPDRYRARSWGELRRIHMPDNSYRWLCRECAQRTRR